MTHLRPLSLVSFMLLLAVMACALPVGSPSTPVTSPTAPAVAETPTDLLPTPTPLFDAAQLQQAMDSTVSAQMQADSIVSCSLAVEYPDSAAGNLQTSFFNYGTLSKESSTPVDATTEYEIGSLTKLFTTAVLAQFVLDGALKLDDPLQQYLPVDVQVPVYNGEVITLGELATHTSGLPRNIGAGLDNVTKINGVLMAGYNSEADVFKFLNTYTLTRAPGAKWEYSNLANGLLGVAEARAGQTSYEDLVRTKLTVPLGMPDTFIVLPANQANRLAQGYTGGGKRAVQIASSGATLGGGAFRSTAQDMAVYLAANIDPAATSFGPAFQLTQQQHAKGPNQSTGMGLGWLISNPGTPDELFNKAGSTTGYNAYIAFSKARRTGFVALCSGHAIRKLLAPLEKLLKLPVVSSDGVE